MVIAEITFGELLLLIAEIFLLTIWIWLLFVIIADLFRDHEQSGWAKAAWIVALVFLPYLGALIYVIARGEGMRERQVKAQAEAREHFDSYVRQNAQSSSPAEELRNLHDLREKGAISDQEFEQAKLKVLA